MSTIKHSVAEKFAEHIPYHRRLAELEQAAARPAPPDHFTKRDCLDCHGGHGGTEAGLLRAGWQPATRPATPQATR